MTTHNKKCIPVALGVPQLEDRSGICLGSAFDGNLTMGVLELDILRNSKLNQYGQMDERSFRYFPSSTSVRRGQKSYSLYPIRQITDTMFMNLYSLPACYNTGGILSKHRALTNEQIQ